MGGKDKKLDYSELKNDIDTEVGTLILFGENKFELAKTFKNKEKIIAKNSTNEICVEVVVSNV